MRKKPKVHLLSLFVLISLFISVSAQNAKQPAPQKPDATEQRLRAHVAYLASDKLEGRRTGERGATFAAGYVANMFSSFKLKPGFTDRSEAKIKTSFLQPFPFITGVQQSPQAGNEFRIVVTNSAGNAFQTDNLASWKTVAFSPNADIAETPVVFAGYGVVSENAKYDDYANLNVANKIALAFDGTPNGGNLQGGESAAQFDARAKAKIAKDKGAKGLFIISRMMRLEDDPLYKLEYDPALGESALPVVIISRRTAAALFGTDENGLNRVESLIQTRNESGLNELRAEMQNRLQSRAAFKINFIKKQVDAYNVIGVLEGSDPVLKNEAVVIAAHYDHLGRGGQGSLAAAGNSAEIHRGADDNASGVAALIELARQFSVEKTNKRTIIFIAFGGEEEELSGSKFYVANPVFPLDKTVLMINIDAIGRLNANKLIVGGTGTAEGLKTLVEIKNRQTGRVNGSANDAATDQKKSAAETQGGSASSASSVSLTVTPAFDLQLNENASGFSSSDHTPFYGRQIPVLFFSTGMHADYHKPSDTAEKINYAGLAQIVSFVSEIIKTIDGNSKRPSYISPKGS